jgi:FkbM family methyltransferase
MMARVAAGDPTLPPNGPVNNWIAHQFPEGYRGYCIDVGASDGLFVNSTYLLEKDYRWTVLSVEANPAMKPLLVKHRAFVKICAVGPEPKDGADFHINLDNLEAFSSLTPQRGHPRFREEAGKRWGTIKVDVRTLEQLLAEWEFPRLDALCVDVEGGELDVLKGINLRRWKPHVVVVESWEAGALDDYLVPKGYARLWRSADNDAYIRGQE